MSAAAEAAGLTRVSTTWFSPGSRFWTFSAPESWTPLRAVLRALDSSGRIAFELPIYPESPCRLGTSSRAVPAGIGRGPLFAHDPSAGQIPPEVSGCWVLVRKPCSLSPSVFEEISAAGGLGIITDAATREGSPGRIELPPGVATVAWSLTTEDLSQLTGAMGLRGQVEGIVQLDDVQARLPVVTAQTRQGGEDEPAILVTAHMCHRAPGANDNGSGVVTALGVAAALQAMEPLQNRRWERKVRFVWAPEFSGTAAWLYRELEELGRPAPLAVVNLDMVGEDQQLCGGPLVLEGTPDHIGSWLEAIVEESLRRLPTARSWSGATAAPNWSWVSTPFAGGSDHALFADQKIARPAVQLGHWPDRFNHSAADTIEAVDPGELTRVGTIVAALTGFAATASADDEAWLRAATASRSARRMAEVVHAARVGQPLTVGPGLDADRRMVIVPEAAWLLRWRLEGGLADLASISGLARNAGQPGEGAGGWERWLRGQYETHLALLSAGTGTTFAAAPDRAADRILRPCWPGPFNLRGLREASTEEDGRWLDKVVRSDRGRYTVALAVALALDGETSAEAVLRRASASSGLPLPIGLGYGFLDVLLAAGWAEEVPADWSS